MGEAVKTHKLAEIFDHDEKETVGVFKKTGVFTCEGVEAECGVYDHPMPNVFVGSKTFTNDWDLCNCKNCLRRKGE